MKVLVVDDDRVLADLISFTLRRAGFQVLQVYDGEAALQSWANEQPDLVVLDVNLPGLDGFTVCRRIREKAQTPIVLLTVRAEDDDVVKDWVWARMTTLPSLSARANWLPVCRRFCGGSAKKLFRRNARLAT